MQIFLKKFKDINVKSKWLHKRLHHVQQGAKHKNENKARLKILCVK